MGKWPDLKLLSYLENDWYYHQLAHTRKVKHREIEPKDWVSIDTQEGKTYYSDFTERWEESWKQVLVVLQYLKHMLKSIDSHTLLYIVENSDSMEDFLKGYQQHLKEKHSEFAFPNEWTVKFHTNYEEKFRDLLHHFNLRIKKQNLEWTTPLTHPLSQDEAEPLALLYVDLYVEKSHARNENYFLSRILKNGLIDPTDHVTGGSGRMLSIFMLNFAEETFGIEITDLHFMPTYHKARHIQKELLLFLDNLINHWKLMDFGTDAIYHKYHMYDKPIPGLVTNSILFC